MADWLPGSRQRQGTVNTSHFQWGYMKRPVWISDHLQGLRRGGRLVAAGLLLAGLMVGTSVAATAQPQGQGDPASGEQVGPVNQEQALERVRARFPGTVISINQVRQDGRLRYRVRLDNEGNIYTVFVDQATGAISRE